MKKDKVWIFFIVLACLFIIGFAIRLCIDYFDLYEFGSSPFWLYIAVRFVEFIIPAIASFIVGLVLKKKFAVKK